MDRLAIGSKMPTLVFSLIFSLDVTDSIRNEVSRVIYINYKGIIYNEP